MKLDDWTKLSINYRTLVFTHQQLQNNTGSNKVKRQGFDVNIKIKKLLNFIARGQKTSTYLWNLGKTVKLQWIFLPPIKKTPVRLKMPSGEPPSMRKCFNYLKRRNLWFVHFLRSLITLKRSCLLINLVRKYWPMFGNEARLLFFFVSALHCRQQLSNYFPLKSPIRPKLFQPLLLNKCETMRK